MKRFITCFLAGIMLISLGNLHVSAEFVSEEPVPREPGYCGEAVTWTYADGVLTLEGSGRMDDFYAGQPWQACAEQITQLKIADGITYVGAYAFPDYDALKTVQFGGSLTEIGQSAFSGCDGLTEISLPGSFRIFGEESFSHCKNLKAIHFEGGFPKFKMNSMWDTFAKLYYPAERPWPLEHIRQLEEAFQGRIEFLASDGTDPYVPEEAGDRETTEATEPSAQPPAETEMPTEAPHTEPAEEVTEAPRTEPAEEVTEAPSTEAEETQETAAAEEPVIFPESQDGGGGLSLPVAGLIFLMVISGGGAIFLLGRMTGNQKKDFTGNFSEILLEDEKRPRRKAGQTKKQPSSSRKKKGGKYQR